MRILIIGGTRFVGYLLTWRLIAAGHSVTLFHRGTTPDPFGNSVHHLHGDRTTEDFPRLLRGQHFDAVVDFAAYTAADAKRSVEVFSGNIGHYVFISTGQVYLVRQGCPIPARESDYSGPVMSDPGPTSPDYKDWLYGVDKRAAEDTLAQAFAGSRFPGTCIRIPMVNGERDYYRRIESYLWRILDGGPILLPDGGERICRHVYGRDVANAISSIFTQTSTLGAAYNLCQEEEPTLKDLMNMLAELLGARANLVSIGADDLVQRGLKPKLISPFSDHWMSRLDPALARRDLKFTHRPLRSYLENIVTCFLAHPPEKPPENYALRPQELQLARQILSSK